MLLGMHRARPVIDLPVTIFSCAHGAHGCLTEGKSRDPTSQKSFPKLKTLSRSFASPKS